MKGVRKDCLYTIKDVSINNMNCDNNGSYGNNGSNKKTYYVKRTENNIERARIVRNDSNNRFYYKERKGRQYYNEHVPSSEVYTVERICRRNKSISRLKHLIVRVKSEDTQRYKAFMCVVYILSPVDGTMSDLEAVKILPHKNSKLHDKPYIRTCRFVTWKQSIRINRLQRMPITKWGTVYFFKSVARTSWYPTNIPV